MAHSQRRWIAPASLGLLAALLFACGSETPQTTAAPPEAAAPVSNAAPDAVAKAPEPEPPTIEPVSLPEDYPGDVPELAGFKLEKVNVLHDRQQILELMGTGDPAALRVAYEAELAKQGWEIAIGAELAGGKQQSILATKGKRSLTLMLEASDGGVRAQLGVQPEKG